MMYSPSMNAFYIHSIGAVPPGCIEISDETHAALLQAQTNGKVIQPDENGYPIAVDHPAPSAEYLAALVRSDRDCRMICALDAKGKYTTQQELIAAGGSVVNPITAQEHVEILQYIEDLRNIPQQAGFPWTGPTDPACPWPTKPGCVCDMPIIG